MDEAEETQVPSVGERLRAAREEKGLSLEDIAAQTRIPQRHLESIETGSWDNLPAPTYTIGFARSYASSVGLDRAEIADQLRAEMGGQRPPAMATEVFEPADPARTMPKGLVIGAIVAVVVLVLVMTWLSKRSLEPNEPAVSASAPAQGPTAPVPPPVVTPAPAPIVPGPVVLTASEPVWIRIKDGDATLKEGIMQPGESYQVPPTASAPMLTTGKPDALRVNVGTATAPPIGAPATTVHVSLRGPDLMGGGVKPNGAPPTANAPPPAQ